MYIMMSASYTHGMYMYTIAIACLLYSIASYMYIYVYDQTSDKVQLYIIQLAKISTNAS